LTNKIIKIEAEELWNNDFSWKKNIFASIKRKKLGKLMLKSARMLVDNPEIAAESLPLCKVKPLRYVKKFKQIFISISEKGYIPTEKDVISVYDKRGTLFCCDGHRRLACILALGKQKMIEVSLSPTRSPGCSSLGNLF
jgi:hypothetical protein